jgi:hypothetical protein
MILPGDEDIECGAVDKGQRVGFYGRCRRGCGN